MNINFNHIISLIDFKKIHKQTYNRIYIYNNAIINYNNVNIYDINKCITDSILYLKSKENNISEIYSNIIKNLHEVWTAADNNINNFKIYEQYVIKQYLFVIFHTNFDYITNDINDIKDLNKFVIIFILIKNKIDIKKEFYEFLQLAYQYKIISAVQNTQTL